MNGRYTHIQKTLREEAKNYSPETKEKIRAELFKKLKISHKSPVPIIKPGAKTALKWVPKGRPTTGKGNKTRRNNRVEKHPAIVRSYTKTSQRRRDPLGSNLRGARGGGRSKFATNTLLASSFVKKIHKKAGKPYLVSHAAKNRAAYQHMVGQGISNSPIVGSSPSLTYEYYKEGERRVDLKTRVLLQEIATPAIYGLYAGSRIGAGIHVVSPNGFGGLAAVYAKMYEFYKIHKMTLHYVTRSAALDVGSISMYYVNDPSHQQVDIGEEEKMHASTHDHYIELPVWQNGTLTIDTQKMVNQFLCDPSASSEDATTTQGLIVVSAGSTLPADAMEYGTLYATLEMTFWKPSLAPAIENIHTASLRTIYPAGSYEIGEPILLDVGALVPNWAVVSGFLPERPAVLVGSVVANDLINPLSVGIVDEEETFILANGVGVFFRKHTVKRLGGDKDYLTLHSSLQSALDAQLVQSSGDLTTYVQRTAGQLVYGGSSATNTVDFAVRELSLTLE